MKFKISATEGFARRGELEFDRGSIQTPAFMPVGTNGTVKALEVDNILETGAEIILGNTYHLMLRPGTEILDTFGGLHKYYNVNPDIAVFGKTLGNGYAINAIIGKDKIMKSIENTFISSTFWTERVGPTAALKVIDIMEKNKTWKIIKKKGLFVKSNWKKLAIKNNLKIIIGGIDAIPIFYFNSKNNNLYKTFITQEMFKHKILATTVIYLSTEHKTKYLKIYFNLLNKIFKKISLCEKNKLNIKELLEVPASISGIREKV